MISVELRRSTVLADARRLSVDRVDPIVKVGRRCANCPRVGAQDEWPRQPGPLSSHAFAIGAAIVVVASAIAMMAMSGASA